MVHDMYLVEVKNLPIQGALGRLHCLRPFPATSVPVAWNVRCPHLPGEKIRLLSPSLRAKRSNPRGGNKVWIARVAPPRNDGIQSGVPLTKPRKANNERKQKSFSKSRHGLLTHHMNRHRPGPGHRINPDITLGPG